jgi:hypothetical protein
MPPKRTPKRLPTVPCFCASHDAELECRFDKNVQRKGVDAFLVGDHKILRFGFGLARFVNHTINPESGDITLGYPSASFGLGTTPEDEG